MTNEEKFEDWLDIAEYDLKTAETMFAGGRWLLLFSCASRQSKNL